MEKKELRVREGLRKRMEKHEFLSGGLYRSDIYHDPNQTGNTSGYITTVTENVLDFILEELDKAREEGKLEVLEELLEWDTPLEPIGKFMRLQTKMVHMKKDLISKLTTK